MSRRKRPQRDKRRKTMWETLRKEEVLRKLETDLKHGLTREEVSKRGQKYGKNKLKDKPKESVFIKFIKFINFVPFRV